VLFLGGGRTESPSNTLWHGPMPTPVPSGILIQPAVWRQQTWAENWGLCPFGDRGAGSSSNTMWPGPSPTSVRGFSLIRPTVWPQYTNVTDDRQTDSYRKRTDNIGRTVLQTVAQKSKGPGQSPVEPRSRLPPT